MFASNFGGGGESPTPEQIRQWRRRISAPDNEFPAAAGITVLLGRTADAAVGITHVEAFSTGFRFTLAVRLRRVRQDLDRGGLFSLLSWHPRPGIEIASADRLLFGIEYASGARVSTLEAMGQAGPASLPDDDELVLRPHGASGEELSVDQTYWVSPLPPEGPVTFVLAWPGFGMPESRTVIDAAAILAAAGHSQTLWPPQPVEESLYGPPQPPPRPSTGWFAGR